MTTNTLKNTVLVGKLSITNWEAKKKARSIEAEAEAKAGAKHGTISARKSLLPGAEALDDIIKHAAAMRTWWNAVSAPWFDNGMRAYNIAGHLDIMTAYGDMARHRDGLVQAFLAEYPELREKARFDLNDLFDDEDYPLVGRVAARFTCAFEVMPLPDTADFRVVQGLDEAEIASLQMAAVESERARVALATDTAVRRLHEAVSTMAARLKAYTAKEDTDDKTKKFYDSWVLNVQELAGLMPQLNITGDHTLAALAEEAKALAGEEPAAYKNGRATRENATKQAESLAARLAQLFGTDG